MCSDQPRLRTLRPTGALYLTIWFSIDRGRDFVKGDGRKVHAYRNGALALHLLAGTNGIWNQRQARDFTGNDAALPGCRRGLAGTGIAQDENAPVFVADVNIAARIHQHVFGLIHEFIVGQRAITSGRGRRNEPSDFSRQIRILDVVNAQSGIEVGEVDKIALLSTSGRWYSRLVLWGPKRPPLLQKSAYGAPCGGTGVGKIDTSRGLDGSLISTIADMTGALEHAGASFGSSPPPVASPCT